MKQTNDATDDSKPFLAWVTPDRVGNENIGGVKKVGDGEDDRRMTTTDTLNRVRH